jgi:hypothetical protein
MLSLETVMGMPISVQACMRTYTSIHEHGITLVNRLSDLTCHCQPLSALAGAAE